MIKCKHFLWILAIWSVCFSSCFDKEADFSKYVISHTDGIIKSSSSIRVYLNAKPDKEYQHGSLLPDKVMKISPKVKGTVYLQEGDIVEFVPEGKLKNGATYEVTLDLAVLYDVPKKARYFKFQVKVIPINFMFEEGNLLIEGEETGSLMYQACLLSSDEVETEAVENKVRASFEGDQMPLEWTHEGNKHHFTVKGLQKGDKAKALKLSFTKDVDRGGEFEVKIPDRNEFVVLDIKGGSLESPVIKIIMSDNLNPDQDLKGLVTIDGFSGVGSKKEGNIIYLYPSIGRDQAVLTVHVHPGIKSIYGNALKEEYIKEVRLGSVKPLVSFIGKGTIVPAENSVLIPFSTVALKAVDLYVVKVFNQNMNFFLQENAYNESSELRRTGRPVFQKKIDLIKENPSIDLDKWNDFTIDLSKLVELEKGVVYRIELKFKKSYTTLACAGEGRDNEYSTGDWDSPGYYYYGDYPEDYVWEERDNPCHVSYYTGERFVSRNIINTSLGILAKRAADGKYFICVSDIENAKPVADCEVMLYNYQNQKIDSSKTDREGMATAKPRDKAFTIVVKKDKDKAWLKVSDANALSMSNFDVGGQVVQMGVKGFIYGERGVWRPGDDIYLSLVLEDKLNTLPAGHPIVAQLIDPKGNVIQTKTGNINESNVYCFSFRTDPEAPTGYWKALFKIGGLTFSKTLRIETIKPNRLSINTVFPDEDIIGEGLSTAPIKVQTRWLHGAKTPGLRAITEVKLTNNGGSFEQYSGYSFTDKSRNFESNTELLFEGTTDSEGNFSYNASDISAENAPGVLQATLTTRVFENSGDFSISTQTVKYSPYTRYVGIRLPDSEDNWYSTQKPVRLNGVVVTPKGEKTGSGTVELVVYRLDWRWWWDAEDNNLGYYINNTYQKEVIRQTVTVSNGSFSTDLNIKLYGRYFIKVTGKSGHSAGIIAYFGYWSDADSGDMATMLNISCDKKVYKTGEKIKIRIPSSEGGVAIVSLENGKTVKDIFRVPADKEATIVEVEATSDMCPNIYAHVTLIQPHSKRDNDRPIRLYGAININVENPALHLRPEIEMKPELRPSEEFTVTVKEADGKAMYYTIAIVDEGLLSLTSFRTPDPFVSFYAREALGVKTWDFYDYIYGAYGARLDKAFAIGGDESLKAPKDEKNNRFKPVVLFEGPFMLKKGDSRKHTFTMPDYIGEVRAMVVAANNGQYGSAAASSQVKKALMVSVAMPRLFTPGDVIQIPVTVFAMNNQIKEAEVTLATDSKITVTGENRQIARFSGQGEQVLYFNVKIGDQIGTSTIKVEAESGKEKATVSEQVSIRIPNPRITKVEERELKAGETVSIKSFVDGMEPSATLEITSIPPLNLEQRLSYLLEYPHGCAEQITSKAFPQLSLNRLLDLTAAEKATAETNVADVLNRLKNYQTTEGGIAYWPGGYVSDWASTYVTHFLITAQQQGYAVPTQLLQGSLNYLRKVANGWYSADSWTRLEQAYRLYVLALAQKPDLAAMNRLKEAKMTESTPQWLLAAAYALCNHKEIGEKIIANLPQSVDPYRQTGRCYGSDTRDNAVILLALVHLDMRQDAFRMLEKLSQAMSSNRWYSTQETSFSLLAAASYVEKYLGKQDGIDVEVKSADGNQKVNTGKTVYQHKLKIKDRATQVEVKNNGTGNLYVRQINSYLPLHVVTERIMSGLLLEVKYYDNTGKSVDIGSLKQGQDITAEMSIKNTGNSGEYQELILSYLLPSGFEIINERLSGNDNVYKDADHVDIRDDRFYLYFDLMENRTKTFAFRFNAAFSGEYILPAISCTAMYDNSINAVLPGGKVTIKR